MFGPLKRRPPVDRAFFSQRLVEGEAALRIGRELLLEFNAEDSLLFLVGDEMRVHTMIDLQDSLRVEIFAYGGEGLRIFDANWHVGCPCPGDGDYKSGGLELNKSPRVNQTKYYIDSDQEFRGRVQVS
ncbi:hypothetical protein C8R47DRAFT_1074818 [Mycena vitilis]|nr:hypothetical protein C8R47DRAFT_1074818 [Mycena vitilis]